MVNLKNSNEENSTVSLEVYEHLDNSINDIKNGKIQDVDEVFAEIKQELIDRYSKLK